MIVAVAVFKCCSYFKDRDGRDDQTVKMGMIREICVGGVKGNVGDAKIFH